MKRLLAAGVGLLVVSCALWYLLTPGPPKPAVAVVWTFEPRTPGAILSSPLAAGGRVYVAVTHSTAFRNAGTVYCLDEATGKPLWQFDDGGTMQHTFSSPCLADGRIYVGEGMHANFTCKLYCLDAASGRKLWDFTAEGHIESSPCVADGRVFFGAGDDGLYCLDAVSGKRLWRFAGPYHVDASPAVSGGRVYAGSGVSRTHRTTEAWCLDAADGRVVWRYPTDLPVWGSPVVAGGGVLFGLGNGRLLTGPEPPEKAAGAVVCLSNAGRLRWRYDAGDAVLGRVAAGADRVFVGSRKGDVACLDRHSGERVWKRDLGSPVVASPVLAGERLYVAASAGRVACLDAASGRLSWTYDATRPPVEAQVFATPALGAGRRVYVGAEVKNAAGAAVLYCLRD